MERFLGFRVQGAGLGFRAKPEALNRKPALGVEV